MRRRTRMKRLVQAHTGVDLAVRHGRGEYPGLRAERRPQVPSPDPASRALLIEAARGDQVRMRWSSRPAAASGSDSSA